MAGPIATRSGDCLERERLWQAYVGARADALRLARAATDVREAVMARERTASARRAYLKHVGRHGCDRVER